MPEEQTEAWPPLAPRQTPVPPDLPPPTGPPTAGPPPPPTPADGRADSPEQTVLDQADAAIPKDSSADLWAFRFDSPLRAQEALLASMRLVARRHLTLEDAVIVANARGKLRLTQTRNLSPSQGAVGGTWIGVLVGLFFGPGGPLIGGTLGAAAGWLYARVRDRGINDGAMRRMSGDLDDGQAVLFLLIEDCHRARALHEVSRFPGRLLVSTADPDLVGEVRDRLAVDPWDIV